MHRQGITVNSLNIVAWDWYDAARPCLLGAATPPPEEVTPDQGLALGQALHATFGGGYRQAVQFIGHSLGTLVNSYAVDYLHGNARGGQPRAPSPWDPALTQVTLLDEAAMAKLIAQETLLAFFNDLVTSGDLAQAILAYLLEASRWKDPVPRRFAYLDNYFAAVGRYHPEGANVMLQRRLYDGVLDSPNLIGDLVPLVVEAHGHPINWYLGTMQPPLRDVPGWQQSVPWSVLSAPYTFPPAVFGGRYWLTNAWPGEARFFRLRREF